MRKNSKPGRPAYKPTPVSRRKVTNAAAGGMSHEEIAIALGISRNTLEKYHAADLSNGALSRRMEVLDAMARTALKGNVSAQKSFLAMTPTLAAPPVDKEKPVGKKEQANRDAVTAADGTEWSDLLPDGVTPIRRQA
ncbi:hypothetical protein [Marilutibacter spongiae]|uniref:Uncharacterized protein n=1 Tax=Marilutibacter spongiae TaxID=2025720 RepID=A0A7W3TLR7_9GAMM|nr:hypothetical protein [Lysobacter spongiae]MBB1060414.1 hypothetical protein [Lysobacter spongiae]